MKRIVSLLTVAFTCLIFSTNVAAQNTTNMNKIYDAEAAKKMGADDYGMKTYVFAVLKDAKPEKYDEKERQKLQMEHLKNIFRMVDEGKIVLVGPFLDGKEWQGMMIFDVRSIEEAKKLVDSDPLVKAGYMKPEYHSWYGSAALVDLQTIQKKIQKKKIVE